MCHKQTPRGFDLEVGKKLLYMFDSDLNSFKFLPRFGHVVQVQMGGLI